ncbi:expressed unknown protein (Partial), partial [Seminavis robusta]|eukprot:Sro395_g134190.1 n/a (173) ;mRNA; f:69799-70317
MASKHRRQRSTGSMLNGSITNLFQKTLNPAHHMRGRIVKKAAGVVDEYVNDMSSKAPFLCESTTTSTSSSIPLLDHNELVIGKLLGEGGFCQVWDVSGIVLHTDNNNSNNGQNEWRNQQDARQQLAQCAKQQPLAVKQLRKRLTKYPPRFTLACADLVTEAQYLSKLSHHLLC